MSYNVQQDLKLDINKLDQLIKSQNIVKRDIGVLKKNIISKVKTNNLTPAKFDYGSHYYKYRHDTSKRSITQKSIQKAIESYYPTIDFKTFIEHVKEFVPNNNCERFDLVHKKNKN